jgi:hypothetical protein
MVGNTKRKGKARRQNNKAKLVTHRRSLELELDIWKAKRILALYEFGRVDDKLLTRPGEASCSDLVAWINHYLELPEINLAK